MLDFAPVGLANPTVSPRKPKASVSVANILECGGVDLPIHAEHFFALSDF
jgi:hypothetical protein